MQQVAIITDALPVLDVKSAGLPFTLLPHQLGSSISGHADFSSACRMGFESYCEGYECFVEFSTLHQVQAFIVDCVARRYDCSEALYGVLSLPHRVGFCLGWLSALAATSRGLAGSGLRALTLLARSQYREEVSRGCNPLVEVPGLCLSAGDA